MWRNCFFHRSSTGLFPQSSSLQSGSFTHYMGQWKNIFSSHRITKLTIVQSFSRCLAKLISYDSRGLTFWKDKDIFKPINAHVYIDEIKISSLYSFILSLSVYRVVLFSTTHGVLYCLESAGLGLYRRL